MKPISLRRTAVRCAVAHARAIATVDEDMTRHPASRAVLQYAAASTCQHPRARRVPRPHRPAAYGARPIEHPDLARVPDGTRASSCFHLKDNRWPSACVFSITYALISGLASMSIRNARLRPDRAWMLARPDTSVASTESVQREGDDPSGLNRIDVRRQPGQIIDARVHQRRAGQPLDELADPLDVLAEHHDAQDEARQSCRRSQSMRLLSGTRAVMAPRDAPIVRRMPMSRPLSFTSIMMPEMMFRAATRMISDRMMNITVRSTSRAL